MGSQLRNLPPKKRAVGITNSIPRSHDVDTGRCQREKGCVDRWSNANWCYPADSEEIEYTVLESCIIRPCRIFEEMTLAIAKIISKAGARSYILYTEAELTM